MTSSLTTALEEMRRENNVLKTDNTHLRTNVDAMKNEITQQKDVIIEQKYEITQQKDNIRHLTTLLEKMAVNSDNQIQQINPQSSEIAQLKVSYWSGITSHSYTTPNIHTL